MRPLAHIQHECGVQLSALGSAHLRRSSYGLAKRQFSNNTGDPSIDWVCVRKNQKLGVTVHIFGQDLSYNQDCCLFFTVHEVVCPSGLSLRSVMVVASTHAIRYCDRSAEEVATAAAVSGNFVCSSLALQDSRASCLVTAIED